MLGLNPILAYLPYFTDLLSGKTANASGLAAGLFYYQDLTL
jgi:hypothetical protein